MGSDCTSSADLTSGEQFQSTLPGWGATTSPPRCSACPVNFNPRSPDGERRGFGERSGHRGFISIHAPRMGSDQCGRTLPCFALDFNPRSPDGERPVASPSSSSTTVFQSTLPGWGATTRLPWFPPPFGFQSTLPGWGATAKMDIFAHDMGKIIHFQH